MLENSHAALVADSHPLYRAGLAAILVRCFGKIAIHETASFADTLAVVARNPELAIATVDLALPDLGLRGGLRALTDLAPRLRVIAIAPVVDEDALVYATSVGVRGIVGKAELSTEMEQAFRAVGRGETYMPALFGGVATERPSPVGAEHLTTRQFEVLKLLAAGHSNKQIARDLNIAEGTVKVHVTAAFRMLGVHNRVNAAAALQVREIRVFA